MAGANYIIFVRLTSEILVAFPGFSDIIKLSKERKPKVMDFKISPKIIKPLNQWLKRYGFEAECIYKKNGVFQYDPSSDIITIPGIYNGDDYDSLFMRFLRSHGLTPDFDAITLSLLHELGHSQTQSLMTDEESEECDVIKAVYSMTIDEDSDDFQFKYWEVKDEFMANTWAIMYANCFLNKVQNLENIFEKYVKFG